jgi:c-di-GMP phosphodiesterase
MDNDVLRNIALSYSPMVDRNRKVTATRLTVSSLRPREASPSRST